MSRALRCPPALRRLSRSLATESSSTGIQVTDPLLLYESLVSQGKITSDESQRRMLVQLRKIHRTLVDYSPPIHMVMMLDDLSSVSTSPDPPVWQTDTRSKDRASKLSARQKDKALVKVLSSDEELRNLDTPTGFLLTGPPGTGKSLLMDLFFQSLPIPFKIRRHYDQFLLSLYHRTFQHVELTRRSLDALADPSLSRADANKARALSKGWLSVFAGGRALDDPALKKDYVLACIARDLIKNEGWLLAFDEVQLVDVAGASILRRVLEYYWRFGGVVIGTSNRVPNDLYQHGIQREQFLSFLSLLETRCPIHELKSPVDWRRQRRSALAAEHARTNVSWFLEANQEEFEKEVKELIGDKQGASGSLKVYGRQVPVPWQTEDGIARFTFASLCSAVLGPADYISIASRFHTIIIDQVPIIPITLKNEARRFITLVDALYETKTKLIVHAAALPDDMFFPETQTSNYKAPAATMSDIADDTVDMSALGSGAHPYSASRIYEGDAERIAEEAAKQENEQPDSLVAEALSEVMQDLEAPYRSNLASYDTARTETYTERVLPAYRATPDREDEAHPSNALVSFRNLALFSGADEKFAYRRAVSRLHEMTSAEYLETAVHTPLASTYRTWERGALDGMDEAKPLQVDATVAQERDPKPRRIRPPKRNPLEEVDRAELEPPKPIKDDHFWGIVYRQATKWGRGASEYEKSQDRKE